jgi:hypothetical protein
MSASGHSRRFPDVRHVSGYRIIPDVRVRDARTGILPAPALLIPRHRRQFAHVLQQNPAGPQIQNAVLAPELQLPIDVFGRNADEHPSATEPLTNPEISGSL